MAGGGVKEPGFFSATSSEPPCSTVADMVTTEPANTAERIRAVTCHNPGDAGK